MFMFEIYAVVPRHMQPDPCYVIIYGAAVAATTKQNVSENSCRLRPPNFGFCGGQRARPGSIAIFS